MTSADIDHSHDFDQIRQHEGPPADQSFEDRLRADAVSYRRPAPRTVSQQVMRAIRDAPLKQHHQPDRRTRAGALMRLAAVIGLCASAAWLVQLQPQAPDARDTTIASTSTNGSSAPSGTTQHDDATRPRWPAWLATAGIELDSQDLDRVAAGLGRASIEAEARAVLDDLSSAWSIVTARSQSLLNLKPPRTGDA